MINMKSMLYMIFIIITKSIQMINMFSFQLRKCVWKGIGEAKRFWESEEEIRSWNFMNHIYFLTHVLEILKIFTWGCFGTRIWFHEFEFKCIKKWVIFKIWGRLEKSQITQTWWIWVHIWLCELSCILLVS